MAKRRGEYVREVLQVDYHRNGVSGNGFHVVLFVGAETKARMVGIVFEECGNVAVLDVEKMAGPNPTVLMHPDGDNPGGNAWRGDNFEPELREAIRLWGEDQEAKFNAKYRPGKVDPIDASTF